MKAEFILSAAKAEHFPNTNYPEVVFAGKSNVGKSSMINKLLNRKSLVKTGNTPGKTRLINFFNINNNFIFTDIPGYGYAAVSKLEKKEWAKMIESYFKKRKQLKLCILLIDIRREPNNNDIDMLLAMKNSNIQTKIVLTKVDKLSNNKKFKQIKTISEKLGIAKDKLIMFSIITGEGKDEVWEIINKLKDNYEYK